MFSAIEWQDGTITRLDDDDPWADDPTRVIPLEQLEQLRDVMDQDNGTITQRMAPIPELLAAGSEVGLAQASMCDDVVTFRRASGRSVTVAPEAEKNRAWLIALAMVLLVVEVLALSW